MSAFDIEETVRAYAAQKAGDCIRQYTLIPKEYPMATTYEAEMRAKCLSLAISVPHVTDHVKVAQGFYDFVTGKSGASPRDRITAAMDEAGVR